MSDNNPDIYEGLTFAEDLAAAEANRPSLTEVEREPPKADRDGQKWRGEDPRLPEDLARRLHHHLSVGRAQRRIAQRRSDAAAASRAQRRMDAATEGLGAGGGSWWNLTPAEAAGRALVVLDDLERTWGEG